MAIPPASLAPSILPGSNPLPESLHGHTACSPCPGTFRHWSLRTFAPPSRPRSRSAVVSLPWCASECREREELRKRWRRRRPMTTWSWPVPHPQEGLSASRALPKSPSKMLSWVTPRLVKPGAPHAHPCPGRASTKGVGGSALLRPVCVRANGVRVGCL